MKLDLPTKKRILLSILLNAFLVGVTLLLAYRMLEPRFEQRQAEAVDTLGTFHTNLAAERLASRLSFLRDELKENALRLVDPSRGPMFLDPARWLWMRVQDRDWRAPNYLDPLPAPRTDVDTWALASAKTSLVLSQRLPIMKNGVQDFVLIEGGFKNSVFNDLQTDPRFGLWIFDLTAYKKGGLSSARIFERMSAAGSLGKDEMSLLTSDFLGRLFAAKQNTELPSSHPWNLFFKTPTGVEQLGILGFWSTETPAAGFDSTWLLLAATLFVISTLCTLMLFRLLKPSDEPDEQSYAPPSRSEDPVSASQTVADSVVPAEGAEFKQLVRTICMQLRTSARAEQLAGRILTLIEPSNAPVEDIDLEIAYRTLEREDPRFMRLETFFDADIWRVKTDLGRLKLLWATYAEFMLRLGRVGEIPRLAMRFVDADQIDSAYTEIRVSKSFRAPFDRIVFQVSAAEALSTAQIRELFSVQEARGPLASLDLPLSLDTVDQLGARLLMKSSKEDGHVICLDLPAAEARRPEDLIYAKQLREMGPPTQTEPAAAAASNAGPSPDESAAEGPFSAGQSGGENSIKSLRLSEMEKVSSFAENISDERSRVRSRFRIRRPGEKE